MKKLTKGAVMLFSLLAGFSVAAGAIVYAGSTLKPIPYDTEGHAVPHEGNPNSVNANGQTYGTAGDKMYVEDIPELISVIGDHGIQGYITKSDFLHEDDGVTCPEEAAQFMEAKERGEIPVKVRTVYASDGVTVVDTFTLGSD
ncbi:MAG: hypothetical protein IK107_01350 [Oscillospiraceae bacterium]|nr:hypothetical protein [Oscillospiraceae bacterium]